MAGTHRARGGRLAGIIIDVLTGVVIAILLACVVGRYAFGVRAFSVLTASMTPTLGVGDLVVVVPSSYAGIEEGDVVTYVLNSDLDVVTHRVVAKNDTDQTLVTKGDANNSVDGTPVDYRNVVGVVRASVPGLGNALGFLSTLSGKIAAITIIVALLVALLIVRVLASDYEGRSDSPDDTNSREEGATEEDVVSRRRVEFDMNASDDSDDSSQMERQRTAIAAVIAAEFDDDDWDDIDDDLDDDDEWNDDFAVDDLNIGGVDEYDSSDAIDGVQLASTRD